MTPACGILREMTTTLEHNQLPPQSLGDVIDKMTILARKLHFGEEDAYKELDSCIKGLTAVGIPGEFVACVIRLTQMNFEVWNLENEIRRGGEDKFSLEEIGRRALKVRDYNRKRIQYKNEINQLSGLGFREFKTQHRSQ